MNAPQPLRRVLAGVLAAALAAVILVVAPAQAQPYPSRLIRIVVPYPPGGAVEIVASLNAETNKVLQDPATIKKLADPGAVATPGSPGGYRRPHCPANRALVRRHPAGGHPARLTARARRAGAAPVRAGLRCRSGAACRGRSRPPARSSTEGPKSEEIE